MIALYRLVILFLCVCQALGAKNEADALIDKLDIVLSAEPQMTINQCVNVSSGAFFQAQTDLRGTTIDPIELIRHCDSNCPYESCLGLSVGTQFPLMASDCQAGSRRFSALISEREGFLIPYRGQADALGKKIACRIDPRLLEKGYTNLNRAESEGGAANFVNWRAVYRESKRQPFWTVELGDGTRRLYGQKVFLSHKKRKQLGFPTTTAYLLTEEVKPNGNRLAFDYCFLQGGPFLSGARTLNRAGKTLNHLTLKRLKDRCQVKSSCGKTVEYLYADGLPGLSAMEAKLDRKILRRIIGDQQGSVCLTSRASRQGLPLIERVEKPDGRFIEARYNDAEQTIALREPAGPQGETVTTYAFEYGPNETKVWNAAQELTIYRFDKRRRLTSVDTFNGQTLEKQETFAWEPFDGQEGWLRAKAVRLGSNIYFLKAYEYDARGNVTRATAIGNLTGEKPSFFKRIEDADQHSLFYRYSQDGRNLLIEKKTPEGLTVSYDYLPGTNLRVKELHHYDGRVQERTFWSYDENGQVQAMTTDNGSGQESHDLTDASVRRVKTFRAETNPSLASYGKPTLIEEFYLNQADGRLIALARTELSYDENGNETKKRRVGNAACQETTKAYDARQRLIEEKDELGDVVSYAYDENGNRLQEKFVDRLFSYEYDRKNRLVRQTQTHGQAVFVHHYRYDALSRLIAETDAYGHETSYAYDRLGNQTAIVKPAVQTEQGELVRPTVVNAYNLVGHLIAQTNENGETTRFSYNAYGGVASIEHPDGSVESRAYYPNGWLKRKRQTDGVSIVYDYNAKGKVVKASTFDPSGAFLRQETFTYQGPLLVSCQDAAGVVIGYAYDGAGRKILETRAGRQTIYAYDDFDRVSQVFYPLSDTQGRIEAYEYDAKDRLIGKTCRDLQGAVYAKERDAYDAQGHLVEQTIWQSENVARVYKASYQSNGDVEWKEDPLGHRQGWSYRHDHVNGSNQTVRCRALVDPLGRKILEVDNPRGLLARQDKQDASGKQIASTAFHYDRAGRLLTTSSSVMADGVFLREYRVERAYDSRGRLISETEEPVGKKTQHAYDSMGRLIRKDKPDGVSLFYAYDYLGQLASLASSDRTIDYAYQYDSRGNPILIHDKVHGLFQRRAYDNGNRLLQEELSPGVALHYAYDSYDRLQAVALPDGSFIHYSYDAFHLTSARHVGQGGQVKSEAACVSYNLESQPLEIRSPAGSIFYDYDLLGRVSRVKALNWEKNLTGFDSVGNLIASEQIDPSGPLSGRFAYDSFNHLIREELDDVQSYAYDSLGDCWLKNNCPRQIDGLNRVACDESSAYAYDVNGRLISQTNPPAFYQYDALDRLVRVEKEGASADFLYDSFGRCLKIKDASGERVLLHQKDKEIGSLFNGQLDQFRLVHPANETVFALELQGRVFFPVQDERFCVCALQNPDGSLANWTRQSAFEQTAVYGEKSLVNPWTFGNRRNVAGLALFAHRVYNPQLMRWQTTDPLGFEEGLNLYRYNRNNPYRFYDPDGRNALVLTFVSFSFGAALGPLVFPTLAAVGAATLMYGAYQTVVYMDRRANAMNQLQTEEQEFVQQTEEHKRKEKFVFPEDPDDLLPDLPRDKKGHIYTADNLRIRPEKHASQPGDTYNPRHHGQHYHVEIQETPGNSWGKKNTEKIKPPDYYLGMGTGFLPGEYFPGVL